MKKRGQGKRRHIFAGFLCLCVLFTTQPEIWNRLSVFAAEESDTKVVLSFAELSEEIKEQTVPVGTVYEELELPEELNVYMKQTEISSTPNLAEEKSEEETVSGNDMEIGSTEEGEDAAEQEEYYVEQEETTVYAPENSEQEAQELQGVTWQSDPAYGSNTEETYIFTAVLPEGYILAENVCLPQITVTVIESESGIDFVMQDLSDRIATLPDAEEYLASEPDMDDEDSYAEWREKLYEYAEEALDIWEECEALTEEQQAQISEEKLVKLTAWVELAETLEESSQVMTADDAQHKHCVCGGNINIGDHTTHTEDIVYDNILASSNGQLLINGAPQSDYTLTSGNYYLDEDVALSSELVIAKGSVVYICLNNRTLSYDRTSGKHRVITVEEGGATLNLCTCGDFGRIMGGDSDNRAGGLYLSNNSIFYMYGGSIEGNSATTTGGGIYSGDSVLCNLYSTYICNNKGNIGAGISFSGILNIYGGEIKNNEAASYGGGIATGNTAKECIWQDIIICNNTAENYAGGLYCASTNANLIMSDIEISNNIVSNSTARYPAGGVALMQGTISISGAITISGNEYNGEKNNFWNYCNTRNPSKLVIADGLDEQSVIGLTNNTVPTEDSPNPVEVASGNSHTISAVDWSRFFSDDDNYEILLDETNNRLMLSFPGNCDLGGLDLSASGATLSPSFDPDTTRYTSTVANSVDEVGITATLADTASGADIKIKINDGAETSMENGVPKTVDLVEGENTIVIIVTSGEMSKAYTIKITKEEAPAGFTVTLNGNGGSAGTNLTSYDSGTGAILPTDWTRAGYSFAGWYDNENCTGTEVKEISATATGDKEYWAKWTPNSYTVTLHGNGGSAGTALTTYTYGTKVTLPTDWTRTGYTFSGWYDNESCTGTAVTSISASDTGNKEYWAKWTDNIAPVIGTLQYSYEPKNFWNWLIGKDSLVITVPVTEEGSGADEITYTVTPDGGTAKVETATILNGEAKITVSADFKGTISIACTDKANNTSASVTVGAGVAPNGIIIEDNAPQIAFKAENAELLPSGEYKTVPNIVVTVADDKDNAISGGIASVSYQINGGSVKAVPHDYTASMVVSDNFTIQADEITASGIPADGVVISVTATDNAGNSITDTYTVKVHTHSGTLVPAIEPTCTAAGNKQHYTCTCGKLFSDSGCTNEITDQSTVVLDALGHYFEGEPYIVSTTQHWRKCSRCSVTEQKADHSFGADDKCTVCGYSRVVDPGHTHSGILIAATDPTCTLPGNRAYYICSSCGKMFSDSGCTVEITEQETKIEALKHNFSVTEHDQSEHWRKCSRCTEEQSRAPHVYDDDTDADCNVCGYVRTIQGHTHSGTLVAAETPTCTQDGNKAYYTCSCGKWFSDSACTNEITDHASVIVGKLGHDFSGQYLFNANGHWKVCSRCNEEQIPESHVFDDDNDTTCNKCDYRRTIGTHTHRMERAVAATEPTCTVAGNKAYYICSCGKWFSDSACTKEVTAQDVNISAKGHKAVTDPARAATCTETGLSEGSHCSVCGHVIKAQTVTAALGHDYGNYHYDADGHWKVCRRCGAVSAKQGHNYDNDRDTKCNDCGWVRVISDSNHEQDEQPTPTPTPETSAPPQPIDTPTPQPPSPTNPPEQPQPTDTPEDKQESESTGTPEPTEKPSETEKEQQPERDGEQTVPAAVDNGKIVISGEPVATGNVEGMTDTKTVLKLGNGAVIVTVVCAGQEYTAGVTDTLAVANAVLAPEQIQLINNGETIEIRIDVKDISDQVPEQDKETIENGIREYQKEVPGLTLGMYVDISMFIKVGEGGWNAITATREPIEVIIGIPESLQEKGRAYYIIRAHEGVHTFMSDMDADPYTITVSTNMFSSYAIAYVQAEGTRHKCGLCHICPTFLGICCFVWLVIIILIMIVTIILLRKKKKEQETEEAGQ